MSRTTGAKTSSACLAGILHANWDLAEQTTGSINLRRSLQAELIWVIPSRLVAWHGRIWKNRQRFLSTNALLVSNLKVNACAKSELMDLAMCSMSFGLHPNAQTLSKSVMLDNPYPVQSPRGSLRLQSTSVSKMTHRNGGSAHVVYSLPAPLAPCIGSIDMFIPRHRASLQKSTP